MFAWGSALNNTVQLLCGTQVRKEYMVFTTETKQHSMYVMYTTYSMPIRGF